MSKNPYDYCTRQGILPISWEDFHGICKAIALEVSKFQPDIVLPVGRGGTYPGTLIAHLLQVEPYPVRLSRRQYDVVKFDSPQWLVEPPSLVLGKKVLIVDEICGSGETLTIVKEKTAELGAVDSRSGVLYAHSWGTEIPDYIGLITDALVLNPWDREILRDNEFIFHPEYVAALTLQGRSPEPDLLISATPIRLAKSR